MRYPILLLFLTPIALSAQSPERGNATYLPILTVKTNATALLNPVKIAWELAADVRIAERITIDAGAGTFLDSPLQFAQHEGETYRGIRLRAGAKYYLVQRPRSAFQVGLSGKYHDIRNVQIMQVFRQGRQYIEYYPTERRIKTRGLAVRTGWQFYLGKNKRFLLEPYTGLGVVFHQVSRELPADAEAVTTFREFFTFELQEGDTRIPDLLLGLYVGIPIR